MAKCFPLIVVILLGLVCLLPVYMPILSGGTSSSADGGALATFRALRLRLLLMALVCCLLPAGILGPAAAADDRPIIVFRVDDGIDTWLTPFNGLGGLSAFDYGEAERTPITWAIIADFASRPQQTHSISWAKLQEYLDACGGEAASHSVHHTTMATQQEYIDEVTQSKAAIESNLHGHPCNTFIQPGTWLIQPTNTGDAYMDSFAKLDNPIGLAIQANYSQSQAYLGKAMWVGNEFYNYGLTSNDSIDYGSYASISDMTRQLDIVAATPGLIYTVSAHGVQEVGAKETYKVQADYMKAFMDKLSQLRNTGKVRLLSLNEAYHTSFSPNLNHVVDPGFEMTNLSATGPRPWYAIGAAQIAPNGGTNNSRYASLPDGSCGVTTTTLGLAPGRYEVAWDQMLLPGAPDTGLCALASNFSTTTGSIVRAAMDWGFFYSGYNNHAWVHKTALMVIPNRFNVVQLRFQPPVGSVGAYGVDNVSIVSAPTDPAVSPSNSAAAPDIGRCTLSWHTPNDPAVTSIVIRYGTRTHPLTPTDGSALVTVPAVPDAMQTAVVPMRWLTSTSSFFFSVFAFKANGSYSPPDLAYVALDKSKPPTPSISAAADLLGGINAQWSVNDPKCSVVNYRYAVGSQPGLDDIAHWTTTTKTTASVHDIRPGTCYFSVESGNLSEMWSDPASVSAVVPATGAISTALKCPDGMLVVVQGTVTAVFGDCCYVEDANRLHGLKILGRSGVSVGDVTSASGQITTINGERAVTAN